MGTFKKMIEIFRKIVIGYVFYTFILTVIGFFIFPEPPQSHSPDEFLNFVYDVVLSNTPYKIVVAQIFIWTLTSWFLSISMFFSKNTRLIVLKKLSGIKERDEREVQIVGKASRAGYLTTMTILLFLLFLSVFSVCVSVKQDDNVEPGQPRGTLGITAGIGYEIFNSWAIITEKEGYDSYFEYNGLPLSTPTLILLLLVWQIVSYRFVSLRALKVPDE
jgi:hypothetical protein